MQIAVYDITMSVKSKLNVVIETPTFQREITEVLGHVTYLYQHIEPSLVKYEFINEENIANINQNNYMVYLNASQKTRYFLIFDVFDGTSQVIMIPYAIHCSSDKVFCAHLCASNSMFLGSLFDGDLIQNSSGELVYMISDVYKYKGIDYID